MQILAYADDLDTMGKTEKEVIEVFLHLVRTAKDACLTINEQKIYGRKKPKKLQIFLTIDI